jgi:hypothetical protein
MTYFVTQKQSVIKSKSYVSHYSEKSIQSIKFIFYFWCNLRTEMWTFSFQSGFWKRAGHYMFSLFAFAIELTSMTAFPSVRLILSKVAATSGEFRYMSFMVFWNLIFKYFVIQSLNHLNHLPKKEWQNWLLIGSNPGCHHEVSSNVLFFWSWKKILFEILCLAIKCKISNKFDKYSNKFSSLDGVIFNFEDIYVS